MPYIREIITSYVSPKSITKILLRHEIIQRNMKAANFVTIVPYTVPLHH